MQKLPNKKIILKNIFTPPFIIKETLNPITENTTTAANMDVVQLVNDTIIASRQQLLLAGLYELKAIRPPKARPKEKKICVPASNQTTGSKRADQRGVNKCAIPSEAPKSYMDDEAVKNM